MKLSFIQLTPASLITALALMTLPVNAQALDRWYDQASVQQGDQLFQQYCAVCHKPNAEGTADWKKTDANGKLPPPPLNGSAHAWHHDLKSLRLSIREGGIKLGGTMPPFKDQLNNDQIDALIAYFQSKWPDDLYHKWADRFIKTDSRATKETLPSIASNSSKVSTRWLKQRLGGTPFTNPAPTDINGIYHTRFGPSNGYLSEDGQFIIIGTLIDLKTGQNLTAIEQQKYAKQAIESFADRNKVLFPAIAEEKAIINVFTDTSCPYCRKLHKDVPDLQRAGITVKYLPFPRGSTRGEGYQTLKQVWCAKDRKQAMDIAKEIREGELPDGNCTVAGLVDEGYELGNRVGVTGTPALFKSNGEKIEGYVPKDSLIPMLLSQPSAPSLN
jgi:thiol:disulfide interchange protein DsbC